MKLSFIDKIKKKIADKKKQKQQEKELLKQMKEEEKALEAELPDEEKTGLLDIFKLLSGPDEEEQEYYSYLTEDEIKEEEARKKSEKKIAIIAIATILTMTIIIVVGVNIFYNTFKGDLLKVTEPIMKEYYKERYNEDVKITNIEELTYQDKTTNEEIKTGIYLATTDENKHIISVNNELLGDDISTSAISDEVLNYISEFSSNTDVISHSLELSYQDYYYSFNRYLDYINALPYNISLDELIASKKLTVTYKLIYQNDINFDEYLNIINNFSDDSAFYLIKHEMGLPVNLTIIKKDSITSLDVIARTPKEEDITHIELDRNKNDVTIIDISSIGEGSMQSLDNQILTNGLKVEAERSRANRDEEEKSKYIMIKYSKSISKNSIVQLSSSYQELNKSDYQDIIFIEAGTETYIISENDYIIATKTTKKQGILCNFGLC